MIKDMPIGRQRAGCIKTEVNGRYVYINLRDVQQNAFLNSFETSMMLSNEIK